MAPTAQHTSDHLRVTDDADRRVLIEIEAAQRRDPFAVGPADRPSRSLRERWATVLAGLRLAS